MALISILPEHSESVSLVQWGVAVAGYTRLCTRLGVAAHSRGSRACRRGG